MKQILTKALSLLLCGGLMLALLSGCGGNQDEQAYVDEMNSIATQMEQSLPEMQEELGKIDDVTNKEQADAVVKIMETFRPSFQKLAELKAPEKYAAAQEKIKTGSQGAVKLIDAVIITVEKLGEFSSVDQQDTQAMQQYASDLQSLLNDLQTAQSEFSTGLQTLEEGLTEAENLSKE